MAATPSGVGIRGGRGPVVSLRSTTGYKMRCLRHRIRRNVQTPDPDSSGLLTACARRVKFLIPTQENRAQSLLTACARKLKYARENLVDFLGALLTACVRRVKFPNGEPS